MVLSCLKHGQNLKKKLPMNEKRAKAFQFFKRIAPPFEEDKF